MTLEKSKQLCKSCGPKSREIRNAGNGGGDANLERQWYMDQGEDSWGMRLCERRRISHICIFERPLKSLSATEKIGPGHVSHMIRWYLAWRPFWVIWALLYSRTRTTRESLWPTPPACLACASPESRDVGGRQISMHWNNSRMLVTRKFPLQDTSGSGAWFSPMSLVSLEI
jgi:hypothetical protein